MRAAMSKGDVDEVRVLDLDQANAETDASTHAVISDLVDPIDPVDLGGWLL